MLTGWKKITEHTGFSRNTIIKLAKEENFPLCYIATKPITSEQAIQDWFKNRLEKTRLEAMMFKKLNRQSAI